MRWHARHAHLPGGVARDVLIEAQDGRFSAVRAGVPAEGLGDVERLPGVVLPGLANAHSHAFHRALRGRTHGEGGTFWTWREVMYQAVGRLDPDRYLALARAVYAEMALAGATTVGEFHYVHHGPGGVAYDDPNAMGHALTQAASDAGIRLTLLDACYLCGGLDGGVHQPLAWPQRRFGDRDHDAWAARVSGMRDHRDGGPAHLRVGAAIHSVRAVPRESLRAVADLAHARDQGPLHIHLSEQPAENEACHAAYGLSPTHLLADQGVLSPSLTAVHATHLSADDIALLGTAGATACFCPTTERDLADGIGPARALADAGAGLALGSDQHAVVDLLEEARALEMHERLRSGRRGRFTPVQLLDAATGHACLGWPDAGRLAVGQRADLVAVDDRSVRTVGTEPAQILLAATAADVDTVVVSGRTVVRDGAHMLGDVSALLLQALRPIVEPD